MNDRIAAIRERSKVWRVENNDGLFGLYETEADAREALNHAGPTGRMGQVSCAARRVPVLWQHQLAANKWMPQAA